jgi:DNA topoisomerase-1
LRELGEHPEGGPVGIYSGRYGPYVSHDGVIASLPKTADVDTFSLDQAVPLLAAQRQKGKGRRRKSVKSVAAPTKAKSAAAPTKARKNAKASGGTKKAVTPRSRPSARPN